jgi:hypothetical protein
MQSTHELVHGQKYYIIHNDDLNIENLQRTSRRIGIYKRTVIYANNEWAIFTHILYLPKIQNIQSVEQYEIHFNMRHFTFYPELREQIITNNVLRNIIGDKNFIW